MKKKMNFIIYTFLVFFCISCKDLVSVDVPKERLISASVFENSTTANAAVMGIYTRFNINPGLPFQLALYTGLYSDELKTNSNLVSLLQIYQNSMNAFDSSTTTSNVWTTFYNAIYQSNAILEGCEKSNKLPQEVKKQLMAESYFLRAFSHFYLVNLFGNVPLVLQTDYSINSMIKQRGKEEVYQQIKSDLLLAEQNLNKSYVGADGLSSISERVRVNAFVASAFLARTELYMQNWGAAESQVTKVLEASQLYDTVGVNDIFQHNSREAIWQLQMPTPIANRNTYEGTQFVLTARPGSQLNNSSTISSLLSDAFEAGDRRKSSWIGIFTDRAFTPNVLYSFPNKYKVRNSSTISERSVVIRVGELYLIRAEARIQQNKLDDAISDLDVIRKRAGLPLIKDTNPTAGKNDLLEILLKERRVELCFEWGHRLLDLKRTGKIEPVMTLAAPAKGGVWITSKQLWPIPQTEIEKAPQLIQNPGYQL